MLFGGSSGFYYLCFFFWDFVLFLSSLVWKSKKSLLLRLIFLRCSQLHLCHFSFSFWMLEFKDMILHPVDIILSWNLALLRLICMREKQAFQEVGRSFQVGFVRRIFRCLMVSFSFSSFFFVPHLSLPQGSFTFPMYYWCSVNMGFEISLSLSLSLSLYLFLSYVYGSVTLACIQRGEWRGSVLICFLVFVFGLKIQENRFPLL